MVLKEKILNLLAIQYPNTSSRLTSKSQDVLLSKIFGVRQKSKPLMLSTNAKGMSSICGSILILDNNLPKFNGFGLSALSSLSLCRYCGRMRYSTVSHIVRIR